MSFSTSFFPFKWQQENRVSSFSLGMFWGAALIWEQSKSCNSGLWPRNTCKRGGNPPNICVSDLQWPLEHGSVHRAFLLLLSFSCWWKPSRQCQCDLQDFKYLQILSILETKPKLQPGCRGLTCIFKMSGVHATGWFPEFTKAPPCRDMQNCW